MSERFTGFPPESLEFFSPLSAHDDRGWFAAHKDVYERSCRAPMQALAAELEPRFGAVKISRIHRDVRFSRDKSPYKTYIAAGAGGRYIALSARGLYVGAGLYKPEPATLKRFRDAVADGAPGRRIQSIVESLLRKGYEVTSHEVLSSAPRGYARDHPRVGLLKMKDIYAGRLFAPAAWLSTAKARERIDRVITDTAPLVQWLGQHVTAPRGRTRAGGSRAH